MSFHRLLVNTGSNHDLHAAGYEVTDYPTLLALTNMLPDDLAFITMQGRRTVWLFDGNVGPGTWCIITPFYCLSSNLAALTGMQGGDFAYCVDSGQTFVYNSQAHAWSSIS